MRIVITGGAGFVGANLACRLCTGHEVIAADSLRRRGSEHNLPRLTEHGVRFEHADVRCLEDWTWLNDFRPEAILDCAAQPSAIDGYRNPIHDFSSNTFPTVHLLDYCRRTGCAIVLWSSNKVYGKAAVAERAETPIAEDCPLDGGDRSLYGCSKVASDLMVQEWADAFGFPGVVNRCSCLAGPWQWGKAEQGWMAWWVIAHELGLPLQYIGYGGRQVRDVLHVDDLADLVEMQLADLRPGAEVFNVGGGPGNGLSLVECTEICREVTGKITHVEEVDEPRRADFRWYVSDISKVRKRYGWEPNATPQDVIDDVRWWAAEHLELLAPLHGVESWAIPKGV